jgi:hypothetical protein
MSSANDGLDDELELDERRCVVDDVEGGMTTVAVVGDKVSPDEEEES